MKTPLHRLSLLAFTLAFGLQPLALLSQSTVTGTILTTAGQPDSTLVLFTPKSTPLTLPPQLIASTFQSVTSGVDGTFTIVLEQGNYEVTIGRTARDKFLIAVPAGNATWPISSLIVSNLTYQFPYSPAYEMLVNKGQTNGYAALDTNGFVPLSEINPALTNGFGAGGGTAVYGTNGVSGLTNNGVVALSLASSASNALINFSLAMGGNATNDDILTSNGAVFFALALSTNATNESFLIGLNATNYANLIGANATNDDAFYGARATNESLLLGLSATNDDMLTSNGIVSFDLSAFGALSGGNTWAGNQTITGALVMLNGWWFTNSGTTTVATGTGAGTGSPTASLSGDPKATDWSGTVSLTTGTSPSAGATICTITFAHAFQNAPTVLLTPANANTPGKVTAYYVTSSATSWTISAGSANNLTAGTAYAWNYLVVGQ